MGLTDWLKKQRLEYRAQFAQREMYDISTEINSKRKIARKQAKDQAKKQNLLDSNGKRRILVGEYNPNGEIDDDDSHKLAQNRRDELNAREEMWTGIKKDKNGNDYTLYSRQVDASHKRMELQRQVNADTDNYLTGGGKGIGGFFGRLFTGRLTQASRDKQVAAINEADNHPLFSSKQKDERKTLARNIERYEAETPEERNAGADFRRAEKARNDKAIRRNIGMDFEKAEKVYGDKPAITVNAIMEGGKGEHTPQLNKKIGDGAYQLGWSSVAWFRRDENGVFTGVHAAKITLNGDVEIENFEGQKFDQIVTRGVDTCTAAIVSKGDLYCFLHLDSLDIAPMGGPSKKEALLGDIQKTFDEHGPKGQQMKLCVSSIAPIEGNARSGIARDFSDGLINICTTPTENEPTPPKPVIQVLDRGMTDENFINPAEKKINSEPHLSHMEFGIYGGGGGGGGGVIFGDKCEKKMLNGAVDSKLHDQAGDYTVQLQDQEARVSTFAFRQDASQETINKQWGESKSHSLTVNDGTEKQQKTVGIVLTGKTLITEAGLGRAAGANKAPTAMTTQQFGTPDTNPSITKNGKISRK